MTAHKGVPPSPSLSLGFSRLVPLAAVLAVLACAGCENGIDTHYGRRSGMIGGDSVNGTAVLARMFEAAGHRVKTATRLSPRLYETADCIVWVPDDFTPPKPDVRAWFAGWWRHGSERTLIYIGRDFDAAPLYWKSVKKSAAADDLPEIERRVAMNEERFLTARGGMPEDEDCDWFVCRGKRQHRTVTTLEGAANWVTDVDAKRLEIELNGRLVPPHGADVLLESQGDVLVSRQYMGDANEWVFKFLEDPSAKPTGGSFILVANGSFLLNLPLVNHEHRKLAGRLIQEIGSKPREVVFLESGPGGPPVWETEPVEHSPTGLQILAVWPFNAVFLQLGALGLIFCYSRLPIFGRPRPLAAGQLADFGRHVAALASLLGRTRDAKFAAERVAHYQEVVRREPGRFRRGTASPSADRQVSTLEPAPPSE